MSYGASWSEPIVLTEEEIFSRPIDNPPPGGDGGAALAQQWAYCGAEDFQTMTNVGVNAHSASFHPHTRQPAFATQQVVAPVDHPVSAPHRLQRRSSEGGLEDILKECDRRQRERAMAAALPTKATIKRAYNKAPPGLRRRPPGTSPALYSKEGWRTSTGKAAMPLPAPHHEKPRTPVSPQVFESMLKHPFLDFPAAFNPMMMIARSGMVPANDNYHAGLRPWPPAGPPEGVRSLPTTTRINPAQEQRFTMAPDRTQSGPLVGADMGSDGTLVPSLPPIRTLPLPPIRTLPLPSIGPLSPPFPEPDEMEMPLTPTTLDPVQPEEDILALMANLPFEALMINDPESSQPQMSFHELDDDHPSPNSSDCAMWRADFDLWEHSSMAPPLFLQQVQGQGQVEAPPVANLAAPVPDPADVAMLDVFMPEVLSMDLPGKENDQPEVIPPVTEMAVEERSSRLKWTPDLHRRFEEAVATLGGAHKATPKAVLRLMKCGPEMHVFHVKSHLQKYRLLDPPFPVGSTRQGHRRRPEQVALDVGAAVLNDISQAMANLETSQAMAFFNQKVRRTLEVQDAQMEQLNQLRRVIDHQQAAAAAAASSSTPGVLIEFKVQVPRLVIVPKECAVIYSSDEE